MANEIKTLYDAAITTAGTVLGDEIELTPGTEPMQLTMEADFVYSSGGTTAKAYVQTTLDGDDWTDIACFAFATSSARRLMNVLPKEIATVYTPTDGALADNTAQSGIFGVRYRVKLVTVGTYAGNTSLNLRVYAGVD